MELGLGSVRAEKRGLGRVCDVIALDGWVQLSEDLEASFNEQTVSLEG